MNGITRTEHFDHRLQQRGLNNVVVMALLQYGECRSSLMASRASSSPRAPWRTSKTILARPWAGCVTSSATPTSLSGTAC